VASRRREEDDVGAGAGQAFVDLGGDPLRSAGAVSGEIVAEGKHPKTPDGAVHLAGNRARFGGHRRCRASTLNRKLLRIVSNPRMIAVTAGTTIRIEVEVSRAPNRDASHVKSA